MIYVIFYGLIEKYFYTSKRQQIFWIFFDSLNRRRKNYQIHPDQIYLINF